MPLGQAKLQEEWTWLSAHLGSRTTSEPLLHPAGAGAPLTLRASPVCALLLLLGAREGRSPCAARVICWL